ncbi:hypothetical protein ACJIZ3_005410 [Penstemon smallii]|uniref:Sieve element occlusion N-terminal domain-containing protein n=1 Tax=Penstemon smallii TaxID=265156 RepID=A0ABD3S520_9LAMI
MSLLEVENVHFNSIHISEEDFLIREIVLLNHVGNAQNDAFDISNIDQAGFEDPISLIIHHISNQILSFNVHSKTMVLLEKLTHYRWDAKVLHSDNELAASLATVKRLPKAISMLKPKFKALSLLINTIYGLNLQHELLDDKAIDAINSKICIATYWIFRSILECSSKISDLKNSKLEQVHVLSLHLNYILVN